MKSTVRALVVSMAALCGATFASAEVVLSTNFDGRTVSGATASNLNWVTNGVADPGDLTVVRVSPGTPAAEFFDTAAAANRLAINLNVANESTWLMDIALNVQSQQQIALSTVTLDAFIFSNAGVLQTVNRDLDLTLLLLDASNTVLDTVSVLNIFPENQLSVAQPKAVSFDLSGNTLLQGQSYFLRLGASSGGAGNNAGLDNFVVNGSVTAVPEPTSLALVLAAAGGMVAARRRRSS